MDRCNCGQPGCFACKIRSIQFSPSAMPSRRNEIAPWRPNNSWEKGVHRYADGTPIHDNHGKVIGLATQSSAAVERMLRDRSHRAQARST